MAAMAESVAVAEEPSPLEARIDFEIMRALEWRSGRLEAVRDSARPRKKGEEHRRVEDLH
jgi:hypothetical protein